MKIIDNIKVPTGNICIADGEHGPLEFLSIGDYGKAKNIKADFMGLDKEINGVPHGDVMPLTEKWVITISSQYGCSMGCAFCDVPKVGPGRNATLQDLIGQVELGISLHPEIKKTKRLNLHYARMGEPTFNYQVIQSARILAKKLKDVDFGFHPVVSTMMPKNNKHLMPFINDWLSLKDHLFGDAGLQISINTTDSCCRKKTMPHAMSLKDISEMFEEILRYREMPKGRKIALNFALSNADIDADVLRDLFLPKYFLCKITPMHATRSCVKNGIKTDGGYEHYYPYKEAEESLKQVGFDVLVFIPSKEEDESRITCGNAILAGGRER